MSANVTEQVYKLMPAILGLSLCLGTPLLGQEPKDSKDVDYRFDKFSGAQFWETTLGNFGVRLKVRKAIVPTGQAADTSYLLVAFRYASDWAFFRGPSEWVIDGARIQIGLPNDGTNINQGQVEKAGPLGVMVEEWAYYHAVPPLFLKKLAASESAEFRLSGKRKSVEGSLNNKARERLTRFINAVVVE